MAISKKVLTRETFKPDPGRVFYRPAVDDVLKRGELSEIKALLKGAEAVKAKYGDIDGLITSLKAAAAKAK
jgi:hypothetical protein